MVWSSLEGVGILLKAITLLERETHRKLNPVLSLQHFFILEFTLFCLRILFILEFNILLCES